MMCASVQKLLSAYMDRQLPALEKNTVGDHINTCATCMNELRTLLEVKQMVRAYSLPAMPPELRVTIEAATIHSSQGWTSLFTTRWWIPSLAFMVLGGWLLAHFYQTPTPIISPHSLEAHKTLTHAPGDLIALHPDAARSKDTQ